MLPLGLTLDELLAVIRTCAAIEWNDRTPPYLQEFIATRLEACFPELSATVRQFDAAQMDALCRHIKATYTLVR
jgi:hypothetical protein